MIRSAPSERHLTYLHTIFRLLARGQELASVWPAMVGFFARL